MCRGISSEGISSQSTHHLPLNPHFESRFHFALNPLQNGTQYTVQTQQTPDVSLSLFKHRLSLPNTHPLVSLSLFIYIYIYISYINEILYINGIYKLHQIVCCIVSCYIHDVSCDTTFPLGNADYFEDIGGQWNDMKDIGGKWYDMKDQHSRMLITLRIYNVCACMPIAQASCVYYIYIYALARGHAAIVS